MGDFDTNEIATPYKWIDGRTIYRKTVNLGSLPSSGTKNVAHGITGLHRWIDLFGVATPSDSSSVAFPIPSARSNDGPANTIGIYLSNTNITIEVGTNRSSYTGYVTLIYTKN